MAGAYSQVESSHAHPKEIKGPSSVTRALLRMTEGVPLVHSILIEKDSRRIGYFMWQVPKAFVVQKIC